MSENVGVAAPADSAIFPPFLQRQHSGCRGAAAGEGIWDRRRGGGPTKLWRNTTAVYSNTDPDRDKETTENAHENDPHSAEEMINEAKRTRQGA